MKKGYWNGEATATFVGVTYEVTQSTIELHWQNAHVGTRRQGLYITYNNESWFIDNEHGGGYYKLTTGKGSPQCGHKSIEKPINVCFLKDSEINTEINYVGMKTEQEAHEKFMFEKNPAEYKRLKALEATITKKYR